MKRILTLSFAVFLSLTVFCQSPSDSITIKKALGTVFVQNNKNLTPKQLLEITKANPEAFQLMQKAKSNFDVATVFGFIGGALVGWPLGTAVAGGDPEWAMMAVGGGLIGVSIPYTIAYNKNAKRAVEIYNAGLNTIDVTHWDVKVGFTGNGIGLKLMF